MLDIKLIRDNPQKIQEEIRRREPAFDFGDLLDKDNEWREIITKTEAMQSQLKAKAKEIGKSMKEKGNADDIKAEVASIKKDKEALDEKSSRLSEQIRDSLLRIPNIPAQDTPLGENEDDNVEVRKWGEPKSFSFKAKEHDEIGVALDILDFDRAAKLSGSRFVFLKGDGARLERALISFMLDEHREKGYVEMNPPYLVKSHTMEGTGQLPKFEEDLYKTTEGMYLIPTAEVPLTSYYRDEFVNLEKTIQFTAYTPCFRSEAGSAGRDVKGMIRQHQFDKVELVKISHPDNSYQELDMMTDDAENILRKLELPFRTVCLCTGDMGFGAAKTFDIEVWLPGQEKYREISSCSNCTDFQARRSNIKFKDENKKNCIAHTLNGSGLAVGRTLVAILENYQQDDGSVKVPEVLIPYMGGKEVIAKQ